MLIDKKIRNPKHKHSSPSFSGFDVVVLLVELGLCVEMQLTGRMQTGGDG